MGLVEDLSAAFVAFVVECDDAAEARRGDRKRPWLVSLAMWRNCMEWLPAEGLTVAELTAAARTETDLNGMVRWGYVTVEGDGQRRSASGRPRQEAVVRPTGRGARAQGIWDGVPEGVEAAWGARLGADAVAELRAALVALVGGEAEAPTKTARPVSVAEQRKVDTRFGGGLPDTMPIVRHGWSTRREGEPERVAGPVAVDELGLDALLARPLTAFALEFEASGKLSLAMVANLLAVLGPEPIPLRDLPDATGIFRAQIDNAVGYLEKAGLIETAPTAAGVKRSGSGSRATGEAKPGGRARGRSVSLTAAGVKARAAGLRKLARLEATWDERHDATLARVREALAPIAAAAGDPDHPPGTWRAETKALARLPRFPLVTHRGGFPDGA
jgi:hypothetical protein